MSDIQTASEYIRRTAYIRGEMVGDNLDWTNRPVVYKKYPDAPAVELPRDLTLPRAPSVGLLRGSFSRPPSALTLGGLAGLLFLADGFTDRVDYGTDVFLYRGAPSAGALYPVEVYLAARGIEGLDDGLYHYCVLDFTLHRLRSGPVPDGIPAPGLIFTGLFYRSAWKYKDRAFRYCLLDTGHVAENAVLASNALGWPARFTSEFNDALVNAWLGIDPDREAALAMIHWGDPGPEAAEAEVGGGFSFAGPVPQASPVAVREEVRDGISQIRRITEAARHEGSIQAIDWPEGAIKPLPQGHWEGFDGPSLAQVIQKRRSARNFRPKTIRIEDLGRVIDLMRPDDLPSWLTLGLVLNEVTDYPDGYYRYVPGRRELVLHRRGFIGPSLARAALDQDWCGRANLNVVLSMPLSAIEAGHGPRSLRLALLEAGRIGQRAYLGAEAMNWGCCGIGAFFDDEVVQVLGLPEGEMPLYILPVGPIKKRTHGGRREEGE